MNLSLTFGSSEQLRHLLIYAASLGAISNLPQEKTLEIAEKIIPHYDRKEIRNRMIKLAHEVKNISCKKLSELPYVSIAADEGSTRGTKNLDFVVECPGSKIRFFPILTLRMDSLLATNYSKVFNIGLRIIHSHGINIGSIIVDGHRGQLKTLNPKWRFSIFRTSSLPWMKSIIVIPCVCHRIHNAFKASARANPAIGNALNFLHDSADNLRTTQKIYSLYAICPPHVQTRWINDADIAFFHLKHNIPFMHSEDLVQILVIFKSLIIEFEDSKAYLSQVYPRNRSSA